MKIIQSRALRISQHLVRGGSQSFIIDTCNFICVSIKPKKKVAELLQKIASLGGSPTLKFVTIGALGRIKWSIRTIRTH
jgi:hypothetical protein